MASVIEGFSYDIFISYRQKDNKHDGWVTTFVDNLKGELEATFKEDVSVYFDENPHDRLQETHHVDKSLEGKLKCLLFIPVLSQTYCDPNSYAWQYEFLAFNKFANEDRLGRDIRLRNGNYASRILPIRIHDLEREDIKLFEKETGSALRAMDFVFKTGSGVNRPLKSNEDHPQDNLNKTFYSDQINKVAQAVKEIILGLKTEPVLPINEDTEHKKTLLIVKRDETREARDKPSKIRKRKLLYWATGIGVLLVIAAIFAYPRIFKRITMENLRSSGKISVAVMPFQNLTSDTTRNFWQEMIQDNLITLLSSAEELKVRPTESIITLLQNKNLTNYASITPSVASSISQKLDANVFVQGTINQIGTIIRLHAKLIDSKTEEVFKSFQIDGTAEKILPLIDSLSKQVKNSLLISKLEKVLTTDFQSYVSTTSSEAYRNYIFGLKAFLKRDYATAIPFLIQASHCDPDFIYSSFLLAFAYSYSSVDKMDQAKELALQNHLKRDKISQQYFRIMTDYQYAYFFETPTEQIKYIRQLLQMNDQSPADYINLGGIYNDLLQFDQAIPEFKKALEIYGKWGVKPVWIWAYTDFGSAYHQTGLFKKEKELYKKAEQDFPDDPILIYHQAILALSRGETNEANRYIEKYKSERKDNSWSEARITSSIGTIYSEAGLLDKAEEFYRKALTLEPDNPSWMNDLAYFLIDKDRNIDEGLDFITKALEIGPDNYEYLDTKGWGLYKQAKFREAYDILQKSWDSRMKNAIYYHEAFHHFEEAKKAAEQNKK